MRKAPPARPPHDARGGHWSGKRVVSLAAAFDADALLTGRVQIAQNGGADLLYWTGSDGDRPAAVVRMRAVVDAVAGVLTTHLRTDLWLGPEAGDVVAYCKAGWRFSDRAVWSNPIPGNHGHPVTEPIPLFLAGGSRRVAFGQSAPTWHTTSTWPRQSGTFWTGSAQRRLRGRSRLWGGVPAAACWIGAEVTQLEGGKHRRVGGHPNGVAVRTRLRVVRPLSGLTGSRRNGV